MFAISLNEAIFFSNEAPSELQTPALVAFAQAWSATGWFDKFSQRPLPSSSVFLLSFESCAALIRES